MNIDALLKELYAYSMFSIRLGLDNIKEYLLMISISVMKILLNTMKK